MCAVFTISTVMPYFVTAATLLIYTRTVNPEEMKPSTVFVSLALIQLLQAPLSMLPLAVSFITGVRSSCFVQRLACHSTFIFSSLTWAWSVARRHVPPNPRFGGWHPVKSVNALTLKMYVVFHS